MKRYELRSSISPFFFPPPQKNQLGNSTSSTIGVPSTVTVERRRLSSTSETVRRMQSEPSVPLYTPLKKDLRVTIPTTPSGTRSRKELDPSHGGVIGVAVNGVMIVYEHPEEGANTLLFDSCGGHADLANRYHYHLPPICLIRSLGGTVPRVSDWWLAPSAESQWPSVSKSMEKSPLIGWAIDGAPIFGPYNPDNGELVVPAGSSGSDEGCAANVLDECNGMILANGVYAYFLTPTAPFVPPCLMGDVPSEAFVDGGIVDGMASTCPFEGTDPLAGTMICDEKAMIFQDSTCPGNRDRLAIRNCFEAATSTFVGEPACEQFVQAIADSSSCFQDAGCCQDLEQTIAAWIVKYPNLDSCPNLESPTCVELGNDNVVNVDVEFGVGLAALVPDSRALLRSTVASTIGVTPDRVLIEMVSGTEGTSSIRFKVVYETMDEAIVAADADSFDMLSTSLSESSGFAIVSVKAMHSTDDNIDDEIDTEGDSNAAIDVKAAELWSKERKLGFGLSMAAVIVFLGIIIFFEDVVLGKKPQSHQLPAADGSQDNSNNMKKPVPVEDW